MRIAFVTTMAGFPWGGSEVVWSRAANVAAQQGHVVQAAVFDWSVSHPSVQALRERGVEIVARPREVRRTLLRRVLNRAGFEDRRTPAWLTAMQQFRPDVVCVSSGIHHECLAEPQLYGWLMASGIPYVVIVQANSERVYLTQSMRVAERKIFDAARQVVFVAGGNLELCERQLAHRFANGVVLLNSVATRPAPLPWPAGDPVFAHVARFDVGYKGQDILFRVLSEPAWRDRPWKLRLFGDGPEEEYVRELIALFGLEARVEFAGHVSDLDAIWRGSHLCVLPSRAEGTPLALLEGFVAGRPAVVTDVGGNAEVTEEGVTGFIAEAATPRSFGAAMERAWNARGTWEAMGVEAHRRTVASMDQAPAETLLSMIFATLDAKFSNEKNSSRG